MTEYRVRGEIESGIESALPVEEGRLAVRQAVRVEAAARADGPTTTVEINDDDLLEVELESGFYLWTTVDRLQSDTKLGGTRGGDDELLLPSRYPQQGVGGQRGFVSDFIKSLKILKYDLPKRGALEVAERIESKLEGDGQFFRVSENGSLVADAPPPNSTEPTLVLIHGTASSTANAYAGFFSENKATWSGIYERYQGRIYGFEHRTLTQSPLKNALDFLDAIPEGANLHLVTHSRGGLVGDLIAHGGISGDAFDADDLKRELGAAFADADTRGQQLELYQGFNRRLAAKSPQVSRYVRVGCPAAGTTLASGRLDIYLSILIHLIGKIPGVGPFLAGLGELAAAVAKERTKPEVLPGLEAQMPKSAFVRLLNASPHELASDLTVLAGDSDGLIKNLANLFYWRANDLVVDTRSMYGGAPRARRLWHLEENRHVTHVNYFKRLDTAQVVQRALFREDSDTTGFETRVPKGAARGHVDTGEPTENIEQPAVILLPGIMGSHLRVTDDKEGIDNRIWLDKSDLMRGRGRLLEMGKFTVTPDGVLKQPYDDFRDYLVGHGLHVMPMAYDWRASFERAVESLRDLIQKRSVASSTPVYLVAHSMGGLVASLFIARFPDAWKKLRDNGGRLVQAGTPNLGSYVIPRILLGDERIIRFLAALDLKANTATWAAWASRYSGLLEMAPSFGGLDFSVRATWEQLGVPRRAIPRARDLASAARVRLELAAQAEKLADEGVLYVAGGPEETPVYDSDEQRIRFTMQGDGRVTWESGIPTGAANWYVPAQHGSLLDCKSAFPGLRELLLVGHTDQLTTERPAASSLLTRGEPVGVPPLAEDRTQIDFIPSREDLEEAALGMDAAYGRREAGPPVLPCKISVVHGDLRYVEHPVIVGHYRGDALVNAELALDNCLKGALQSRHQLELYPGKIGTAEAVLKRREELTVKHQGPTGAIVLGLGNVGELTTGGLIRSVKAGLLRYAQACRDRGNDTSSLKVSALLVGSGEAGLSVAKLVQAFITGLDQANRALDKLRTGDGDVADIPVSARDTALAFISHFEFIELYHDIALEALYALRGLRERPERHIEQALECRNGGRHRARIQSPGGWWTRLSILSTEDNSNISTHSREKAATSPLALKFTTYSDRARVGVTKLTLQAPIVERFLVDAISNSGAAGARLPETLFELLVPLELKAAASRREDLQLVLDEGSAVFPWELLVDRHSAQSGPMGVVSGMLRQLRVDHVPIVSHPEANQILVVGDPPSSLPELLEARKEADHVASLFEKRTWDVLRQIRREAGPPGISASSVISALLTNDPRILHVAGHGIYDPMSSMKSGVVLGGGSDPVKDPLLLLTPAEVRQMRLQPELVFINCCHLGRIERRPAEVVPLHRLAANLAAEFIKSGVKAVIAAGWPVDDFAASSFCATFYAAMLKGEDFGNAVKRARQHTYEAHPGTNTWGAYQCYGDPGFRLLMDLGVRSHVTGRHYQMSNFIDVSELLVELSNLSSRAKVDGGKMRFAARVEELRRLAERKGWLKKAGVLTGIARVYGQLGKFDEAVELFEQASQLESGGVTLTDVEQLANYRVRSGEKRKDTRAVDQGIRDLKALIGQHGKTAERCSLLAGSYKRKAQLTSKNNEDLRRSLREMTSQYIRAAEFEEMNWDYPAANALLGVLLLGGPNPKKGSTAAKHLAGIAWAGNTVFNEMLDRADATLRRQGFTKFWDAVGIPDLAVVRALVERKPEVEFEQLATQYHKLIGLYGSGSEVDSVVNQWNFAEQVAKQLGQNKIADALGHLKTALKL